MFLFPTLGCGVEEALKDDIPATMASLSAFNRWLEDDWGFVYEHRLVTAPMLSLADPEAALAELDSLIDRGARIVHIRPAPVPGEHGTFTFARRSRARPRVGASRRGVDPGRVPPRRQRLQRLHRDVGRFPELRGLRQGEHPRAGFWSPTAPSTTRSRRSWSTACSSVIPTLRVASIENGSDWVALLVKRLKKQANQTPWAFKEDPLEAIRRNVWVTPYYEEDLHALADVIGVERILFGSDWPHGEGLAEPTDFAKELDGFDEAEVRKIMRDNALELLGTETI